MKENGEDKSTITAPPAGEKVITLTLDFTGREELLKKTREMAFEDCRTVENQIVAILVKLMKMSGENKR